MAQRSLLADSRRWLADLALLREGLRLIEARAGSSDIRESLRSCRRLVEALEAIADSVERRARAGHECEPPRRPTKEECFAAFWEVLAPGLRRILDEQEHDQEGPEPWSSDE